MISFFNDLQLQSYAFLNTAKPKNFHSGKKNTIYGTEYHEMSSINCGVNVASLPAKCWREKSTSTGNVVTLSVEPVPEKCNDSITVSVVVVHSQLVS